MAPTLWDASRTKPEKKTLAANEIAVMQFAIKEVTLPATCYVELDTKVGNDVGRSLKQVKLSQQYATATVAHHMWLCLKAAVVTVVLTYVVACIWHRRLLSLCLALGPPAWEFAKSWTSTLTLAGALVTAALALSALPESTQHASKAGYAMLTLAISLVVVVAPFVFNLFMVGSIEPGTSGENSVAYRGWLVVLFISCAVFAGLAQLAVLYLLLDEVFRGYGFWSYSFSISTWIFTVVPDATLLLGFALCVHALRSMLLTIRLQVSDATAAMIETVKVQANAMAKTGSIDKAAKRRLKTLVRRYLAWLKRIKLMVTSFSAISIPSCCRSPKPLKPPLSRHSQHPSNPLVRGRFCKGAARRLGCAAVRDKCGIVGWDRAWPR